MDGGQGQPGRGCVVALDREGFMVLEVDGTHVLSPKARMNTLVETE